MFIEVQKVPPDGKTLDLNLPAERLAVAAEEAEAEPEAFSFQGPVRIEGRIDRANDHAFRLQGSFRARIALACSRCLETFEMPLEEDLNLLYLPASQNVGPEEGEERQLQADDLAVAFYDEGRIDLRQMIREQVYLALPMKPLCRDDCRGLCSKCGTNLNLSSCACAQDVADPRFASLKALLKS